MRIPSVLAAVLLAVPVGFALPAAPANAATQESTTVLVTNQDGGCENQQVLLANPHTGERVGSLGIPRVSNGAPADVNGMLHEAKPFDSNRRVVALWGGIDGSTKPGGVGVFDRTANNGAGKWTIAFPLPVSGVNKMAWGEGNSHSVEWLPGDRFAVAHPGKINDTGDGFVVIFDKFGNVLDKKAAPSSHGVAWDEVNDRLFSIGWSDIRSFTISSSGVLTAGPAYQLPTLGGHDIRPRRTTGNIGTYLVTTMSSVYTFRPDATTKFSAAMTKTNGAQSPIEDHVKSIDEGFDGVVEYSRWQDDNFYFLDGRVVPSKFPCMKVYKAGRWLWPVGQKVNPDDPDPSTTTPPPGPRIAYGFPAESVAEVETKLQAQQAGSELGYGSVWAEWWEVTHDFSNVRTQMRNAYARGATPMIMWYYWAQYMKPTCIENASNTSLSGCGGRTRDDWMSKAGRLAQIVNEEIGGVAGRTAVIVVEPEFHHPDTVDHPSLDGWLTTNTNKFSYAGQLTVAGFGEWATQDGAYDKFPQFAAAVDYLGTQILFSCVRQTDTKYLAAADRIYANASAERQRWSTKPVFVYDVGLSSYSGQQDEPELYGTFTDEKRKCDVAGDYEVVQRDAVQRIFDRSADFKTKGVIAVVFRAWGDDWDRDSWGDYHGLAERWFGFKHRSTEKLAVPTVIAGINAENKGSTGTQPPPEPDPAPPPGTEWQREAESFTNRPVGLRTSDGDASGDAYWNLHSNGAISTTAVTTSAGSKDLTIMARGNPAGGIWPTMKVTFGGTVVLEKAVVSTVWEPYVVTIPNVTAGDHVLSVEFTNDAVVGTEDRNLKLDVASIVPTPSAPPPPPPPTGAEWQQEAEAFATKSTGASASDSNASGNAYWNIWTNGHIETTLTAATTGPKEIRVTARGDSAGGVWPLMRVSVDGVAVSEQTVSTKGYQVLRVPIAMTAGTHTLRIQFTNDAVVSTEDRNLKVDVAALFAAPFEWYQEGESFPVSTAGAATSSTSASNGAYWNVWSNGYVETTLTSPADTTKQLRIVARGSVAGGVWPVMKVTLDDTTITTQTVGSSTWATYTAGVRVTAGTHTLRVHFTNDGTSGTEDRNLHVDAAGIVAGAPVWSLEAEAFTTKPVGAATASTSASGGHYWNLWANGALTTSVTVPRAGRFRIEVAASGDNANGVAPNMRVWVDGVVVRDFTVPNAAWQTFGAGVDLTAGAHEVKLEFTNDALTPTEDRNLKLDVVAVLG